MRRHAMDPVSLVFGLVFVAIGLTFLIGRTDVADLHLDRIWPIPIIVLGGAIVAVSVWRGRAAPPQDEPPA
jgi:hypothetical protein